jgi:hypothetical protein
MIKVTAGYLPGGAALCRYHKQVTITLSMGITDFIKSIDHAVDNFGWFCPLCAFGFWRHFGNGSRSRGDIGGKSYPFSIR